MSNGSSPNIIELVDRVYADIKDRKLRPGDAYLNSADTAKYFKVSTHAANRALQLLAKRRVITRKQRVGTMVALEQSTDVEREGLDVIHLLVREDYFKSEGVLADGVVMGMQSELPRAGIQFNFLPLDEERDRLTGLIDRVLKSDRREAFVLVRSSLATQRLVAQSGCPAVVHGTPYPSVSPLWSLDRDHQSCASQMVSYLTGVRGCRQIVLMMREKLHAGDHVLLDALQHELGRAGLSYGDVSLRCLPQDEELVRHELASCLRGDDMTGVICANEFLANVARDVIQESQLEDHALAGLLTFYRRPGHRDPGLPYTQPALNPEEIGSEVVKLLLRQVQGESCPSHHAYPVELLGV
ncbi:MAG: GntR family transcriptional regulator [Phycisphaeraceae bacterium]